MARLSKRSNVPSGHALRCSGWPTAWPGTWSTSPSGLAALTFLITRDVRSTISVVIVAGACGIAAGTPLAILGGIGRAARLGAIIKGGLYLESLGRVDTIVLDKTGTLTFGRPEVQTIVPTEGVSPEAVLEAAASAEVRSEHPLGPGNSDLCPGTGPHHP